MYWKDVNVFPTHIWLTSETRGRWRHLFELQTLHFCDMSALIRLEMWGTLHLKSLQRRREIYFPKYIYIFVLSIEKRLGLNCPNLGKIIERRWSDNFTRLSEVLHKVVQMLEHAFFEGCRILVVKIVHASGWIISQSDR